MTKDERLEKQRLKLAEMQIREQGLHDRGYENVAGVDEAGRGPLAGPVVAAAVVLPHDFDVLGIDDSKKLSENRRETLYDVIRKRASAYGVGIVNHDIIDDINILQATKLAMRQAIEEAGERLSRPSKRDASAGGHIDYILFDAMTIDEISTPQESVVKGDAKVLAIAAASIVAKVTRDRLMREYAGKYPGYAFEKHKGYGTKQHYEAIERQGICPIHRKSFLKKLL